MKVNYTYKSPNNQVEENKKHTKMNQLVADYQQSNDPDVFAELYGMASTKLKSIASRAVLRNPRLDTADANAAADDAFIDSVRRYRPDDAVPFEAFMCFVANRRIKKRVQAVYYMGANKDIERPCNARIENISARKLAYTFDPGVNEIMDEIRQFDEKLFNVTLMLVSGYTEEEVGRICGGKTTVNSARSWVRRQRERVRMAARKIQ